MHEFVTGMWQSRKLCPNISGVSSVKAKKC